MADGPAAAETLNRALAAFRAGELDAALRLVDEALAQRPASFDALHLRGLIEMRRGRLADAERAIAEAVAIRPDFAAAHLNRAAALAALGRAEEAVASYDRALALRPGNAEAHFRRANLLRGLDRLEQALAGFDQTVRLDPAHAAAWNNRGVVLKALGRLDEAVDSYGRAVAAKPDFAEAAVNRANLLRELRCYDSALATFDRALATGPESAEAWTGRGIALHDLDRLDEALANFDRALQFKPGYAEAWSSRGNVLMDLGRTNEALASYERALAADPGYGPAHWNEAWCRLLTGDFARGWEKFEWRWRLPPMNRQKRDFARPVWTGSESLAGKSVLLHAEQGYGDTIQFCRYAPLVAARGAHVFLEVQPALASLLRSLAGVDRVIARGETPPETDYHCPLLGLPRAFATTLETVPNEVPYVAPDPALVAKWSARLPRNGRRRVGLVWSGNKRQRNDYKRSLPLRRLEPLLDLGVEFISLQKEMRNEDAEAAGRFRLRHFGEELADFSDTAALVATMDAVVAVDTAAAHLAGAMGKPLLLVLSRNSADWRWLREREDSPWYPTAVLSRHGANDDLACLLPKVERLLAGAEPA